jgi:signal transduction histidine kinase
MTQGYIGLVHAYVSDGQESSLAAIGALREQLVRDEVPIEDLVGLHERAMLTLKDEITSENFDDVVIKTSTCFTELVIAYSLADQRKRIAADREQRIERERQRLEALGQMAGGVAHEFNNLLQPITGMAELALEDAEPGGELAEQLGVILDCAKQAALVVQGILTAARKQGPAPRPALLAPLLRKAVHFLSAILPHAVRLDLVVEGGDEAVLCDEGELSQVLLNLVRNAADAMEGRGTVRISLRGETRERATGAGPLAADRCLRLTVADQGPGMTEEVAARAFQPFFTTKPPARGTGLGLSIVMAIVSGWNGALEIDTAPGAGARVSILLPVVDGDPRAQPAGGAS